MFLAVIFLVFWRWLIFPANFPLFADLRLFLSGLFLYNQAYLAETQYELWTEGCALNSIFKWKRRTNSSKIYKFTPGGLFPLSILETAPKRITPPFQVT